VLSPVSSKATAIGFRRRIVLCADDYALAPGVSRAVLDLIALGRLSATSCMTVSGFWPEHAGWLKPLAARCDIGLHFTLTDHRPLTVARSLAEDNRLPGLGRLMARAFAGRLSQVAVVDELHAQLDAFEAVLGAPPQFIDGHQHVHQLPIVYQAVIEAMRTRLPKPGGWLRVCSDSPQRLLRRRVATLRSLVIAALGLPLHAAAKRAGLRTNHGFSGVNRFDRTEDFARLFARFLLAARDWSLIMCHPGLVDAELQRADPVSFRREDEYRFLVSDALPEALALAGVQLARLYTCEPVLTCRAERGSTASDPNPSA
jgi:predicted glycoside hydrolase/deacetylase ChbG (UPF0249 family)